MSANVDTERKGERLKRVEAVRSDIIRVISRLESDVARACARLRASRKSAGVNAGAKVCSFHGDSKYRCPDASWRYVEFHGSTALPLLSRASAREKTRPGPDSARFWHIPHAETSRERYPSALSRRLAIYLKFVDLDQFPFLVQRTLVAPGSRIALSHGIRYPAPYARCLSLVRTSRGISILRRSDGG